jgi:membrane protease YdiL (CAAX protease family)
MLEGTKSLTATSARLSHAAAVVPRLHEWRRSFPRRALTNTTGNRTADRSSAPYWSYEDIGAFLFVVVLLNTLIRLAVRLHFLSSSDLIAPRLCLEAIIITVLGLALYAILKVRYCRPVLGPLGWLVPSKIYVVISSMGGVITALTITYFTHLQGHAMPPIPAKEFILVGLFLGPILEESVFRGCLLPVLTRGLGSVTSVLVTAVLFAAFHGPGDVIHCFWFAATGMAYGWLRLASATTTAAAVMHTACNLTLFMLSVFCS